MDGWTNEEEELEVKKDFLVFVWVSYYFLVFSFLYFNVNGDIILGLEDLKEGKVREEGVGLVIKESRI